MVVDEHTATVARPVTAGAAFGSDVLVDLMRACAIPYVALNPGASLRGLHDSVVNYGGNHRPQLILCPHEETAVNVAHGYAKATGRPMAAAVHNLVGLQHATMGIYTAWLDQEPVLVLGGTGPMDAGRRRPWIDPIHTARLQGQLVRDYVKWDDQPFSVAAMVDSWVAAVRAAVTPPAGPVYLCYDVELQEGPVPDGFTLPEAARLAALTRPPTLAAVDPDGVQEVAGWLRDASSPVLVADLAGRRPEATAALQELAELLGAPVLDLQSRFNLPTDHPLNLTGAEVEVLAEADVVVALELRDLDLIVQDTDRTGRGRRFLLGPGARLVHVGLDDLRLRGWSGAVPPYGHVARSLVGEAAAVLPTLLASVRRQWTPAARDAAAQRAARWQRRHQELREGWQARAEGRRNLVPIATEYLAVELFRALERAGPWSLVSGALKGWVHRLWQVREPRHYFGTTGRGSVGFGLGIGLGAALGLADTDRLAVALQPDGDLLYTPGVLWTAAHHRIPVLIVMFNNRSYYNDEEHQERIARARGRAVETKGVAIRLDAPAVDFAGLARSLGVFGLGPVETPEALPAALEEAIGYVRRQHLPALVDVVTQER